MNVVIAILVTVVAVVSSALTCGEHEVYQECRPCPPINCGDPEGPCMKICIRKPGCYCEPGYLRKNGKCVRKEQCGCCENEVYLDCQPCDSQACGTTPPHFCPLVCRNPGCYCDKDFKRKNGKCIPESQC